MVTTATRRRHPRHWIVAPASLHVRGSGGLAAVEALNLSEEGALFEVDRPLPVGEPVIVRLDLGPSYFELECKGRVCWSQEQPGGRCHAGVRFLDLMDDERILMADLFSTCGHVLQPLSA